MTHDGRLAAVILSGGTAVRLGGADKASIEVGGVTLLERSLAATARADEVVVVGPAVPTTRPVTFTRESPAGGGPAAGVLAGLEALTAAPDLVCVLAVDMPWFSGGTLSRLLEALASSADVALLVDETGRRQQLAGVYRYAALAAARPADPEQEHGLPMRELLRSMQVVEVPAAGDEARDVDTWDDLP